MKISYNWLKWYVPEIPAAEKLADVFTYHLCEVESMEKMPDGDTLFDLNILPNRAHDLLSHHGIARELSGQLGIEFKDPTSYYKIPESKPTNLKIEIATPNMRRYMSRIVRGIKIGPSPEWVVKHLASIGERSINNIVDATNLCMFDCGQPMHAFDSKKLKTEIQVRNAHDEEAMTTLDGKDIALLSSDIVISDSKNILALAGVKGGTQAEVDEHTTDIVLEVANFDPVAVRKTARRLGILTEAAKRFENDLSPELCAFGMTELSALIAEMCPDAVFEEIIDVYPNPQQPRVLTFSQGDVNKKLGATISLDEVEDIFKRYKYSYKKNGTEFIIDVPSLRLDLVGIHDMVEEIGRIYGYEKVEPKIPVIDFKPKTNETYARVRAVRKTLLADGYSEVMTYAFCKRGAVEVARSARGKEFLRTNLADGLNASYELNRLNAPLLGEIETKIFEIDTVFPAQNLEEIRVAYANKKGVVELKLEEFTYDMNHGDKKYTMDIGTGYHALEGESVNLKLRQWSQYPFITRDVAVWVPKETHADALISLCKNSAGTLLVREPQLFDQFTKGDKTSLAIRLVFQSHERTLTDTEISEIMHKITQEIQAKGWDVR